MDYIRGVSREQIMLFPESVGRGLTSVFAAGESTDMPPAACMLTLVTKEPGRWENP
jgi:hypothetical protein